jgi:hypothetical protein
MKSVPKVIGIVGCTLAAVMTVVAVLYVTGWLTWRWEERRASLPDNACQFVGKSSIGTLIPGAKLENGSLNSKGEWDQTLQCHAHSPDPVESTTLTVNVTRFIPADLAKSNRERALSWGKEQCRLAAGGVPRNGRKLPLPGLAEAADYHCGFAVRAGDGVQVELVAVQGVDTIWISFAQGDTSPEVAGRPVVGLADEVLGKLAAS